MLYGCDLRALSDWCEERHLSWCVAPSGAGHSEMVIEPKDAPRSWQRMRLVLALPELRLENEAGETLAESSDLPALLDAVDGGVADMPALCA